MIKRMLFWSFRASSWSSKKNIEDTVNFTTAKEGLRAVSEPNILITRIQDAFDSFETQTGRKMTYSEMREMMG